MKHGVALTEDVLIEILIRLPVKSLMRFRCVSKYLHALIRSPYFITKHQRDSKNERLLLKRRPPQDNKSYVLSIHYLDSPDLLVSPSFSIPLVDDFVDKTYYDFLGTCNGLVCVALSDLDFGVGLATFKVVLCNPALREFKVLDNPTPFACPEGYVADIMGWGFGFDANTNAYKVVQLWDIFNPRFDSHIRIDLYDSSINSWRLIDAAVPDIDMNNSPFNFFFNGACHWETENNSILSFDLSTEVFQLFKYPNFGNDNCTSLIVFNQCLSLMRFMGWNDNVGEVVDVWVMKEYGVEESWTKELVIGPFIFRSPLLFLENEWLLVETEDGQLAACALRSNEVKRFYFYGTLKNHMQAVIFTESLVTLK